MASKKTAATRRYGGPGAAHENRKAPHKSKPRGRPSRLSAPKAGNLKRGIGPPPSQREPEPANPSATRPGRRARPDLIVAGLGKRSRTAQQPGRTAQRPPGK